ncbi:MAG: hypothetical protein CMH70_09180 [Nitrosomonadaceae bacterium]|mgnify:CR=1 FL=1|nr:hypothetical protein [Nitrosomonadaceae bacterium]MBL80183.1 hypothetical protein [Nitrosomonadaceae bacterium]
MPIEDLYERRALKKEVDVFQNEQIEFFKNFESITLLECLFNLPLPEAYRDILLMVLHDRISRGLRSSVLADIDGDGHWELIGMENPYIKLTTGTSDPKKGFHSAYDLPFPVLKGHDTNNTHTAFQANLFKPLG